MRYPYVYNINTHTLHIEGFCHNTWQGMRYGKNYKLFSSEEEVLEFDGRAVGVCKLCQRKRDTFINANK